MKKPKKEKSKKTKKVTKVKDRKVVKKTRVSAKPKTMKPKVKSKTKKPAKHKRAIRRTSPRKTKVEQAVRQGGDEQPKQLEALDLEPAHANSPVPADDEVMADEPEQPLYEEPEIADDWRGAFAEPAPPGWKGKHFTPGFKVA